MNTVAGAEKIAAPDTVEAYYEIRMSCWVAALEFVGECDRVPGANADNAAKRPFFVRPIFSGKKCCLMASCHQRARHAP
jgi:hypothetical protein